MIQFASPDTMLFERNLQALVRNHPHLARFSDTDSPRRLFVRSVGPCLNLFVSEDDGSKIPLYPEEDPLADLPLILDHLKGIEGKIICIYGLGLGIYAAPIVEEAGAANLIVFFEALPEILYTAMGHMDLSVVFSHPNVRLVVGELPDFKEFLSSDLEKLLAAGGYKSSTFNAITSLAPEWYSQAQYRFARFIASKKSMAKTLKKAGRAFFNNRFNNLMAMAQGHSTEILADKFKNVPAVIVASGPSLVKNIDLLKGLEGKALIIAVDSAIAPLAQRGIIPHLVASVDRHNYTYEKLAPFTDFLRDVSLLFLPEVTPKIPNYIAFRHRFYTFLGPMYANLFNDILGVTVRPLEESEAVNHLALGTVQKAGCNPIIFVGLDLAFADGNDHAEGTILHWGNQQKVKRHDPKVEDINGNLIPTNSGFISILATTEKLMSDYPDRLYIDATEGGAKVKGSTIMPLRKAIELHCQRSGVDTLDVPGASPIPKVETVLTSLERLKQKSERLLVEFERHEAYAIKIEGFISQHAHAPGGIDVIPPPVSDCLRKMAQIGKKFNEDEIILALNDIMMESHLDEYRQVKVRVMTAQAAGKSPEIFVADYAFRQLVHRIRFEAFQYLIEHLDRQTDIFREFLKRQKMVDRQPDDNAKRLQLARFYFENDCLAEAETLISGMNGQSPQSIFYQGCIRVQKGDVDGGLAMLNTATDADGSLVQAKADFIRRMEKMWLADQGPLTFNDINRRRLFKLSRSPRVLKALLPVAGTELCLGIQQLKDDDGFVPDAENLLALWAPVKDELPDWQVLKARCIFISNTPQDAIDYMTQLIRHRAPAPLEWMTCLVRLLIENNDYEEGFNRLDAAVKMDPAAAVLWEEIGDLVFGAGDPTGARIAYEKCFAVLPAKMDALMKIGDTYIAEAQYDSAEVAYRAIIENEPDNQSVRDRLVRLEKLKNS